MSNIIPFQFDKHSILAATNDVGDPMFVAKNISDVLGYDQTANALKLCKRSSNLDDLNKINGLHPATKWIPESDVYRLIMRSNMPNAERFQDWVTEEVLPSIRKTGAYAIAGREFKSPAPMESAVAQIMNKLLPDMVHAFLAQKQTSIRNGVTAGQVWARHGLPKLKNGPQMLSRLLIKAKCAIEGGGRAEIGGKTAKLFDPDKADAMMKYSLLSSCLRYIQERDSQTTLNFEHARKTEAKIKEIVAALDGL